MSYSYTDNNVLFADVKSGNIHAFEFLFKSYYPRLLRYALRFVKDEDEARDILQDSFISFWEKREFLLSVSIKALLFTIVRNNCLNHLKHQSVAAKYHFEYLSEKRGEEHLYHLDFLGSTDDNLVFNELNAKVNLVIDSLPERCKEVFLLSRFEGLKNREISEKLNISLTAVEKHISKALSVFSKEFDKKQIMLLLSVYLQSL